MVALVSMIALAMLPSLAFAIDTNPGGYIPLPDGRAGLSLHWQRIHQNEGYRQGKKVLDNFGVTYNVMAITYAQFTKIGDTTVAPGFMVTCGNSSTSGTLASLRDSRGCGDLILGMPIWVLNSPETGRYLGISPYISMPTGSYHPGDSFNLGENRWKAGVNAGFVTPLVGKLNLDLVGDLAIPGKNRDYGTSRVVQQEEPFYSIQTHLRYQIDPGTRVSLSYFKYWGGEATIAGVAQNDRLVRDRYRISLGKFITPRNEIQLDTGRDLSVNTGSKVNQYMSVRLVHIF